MGVRIVTGILTSYRDLDTFRRIADLSPGFARGQSIKHVLLMFESEYLQMKEFFTPAIPVAKLGDLNTSQASMQCTIKVVRWTRLASIIHPGADFIGWQDVDTWISFPRLYAFLRSIPEQGRPNAYIGLPQYLLIRFRFRFGTAANFFHCVDGREQGNQNWCSRRALHVNRGGLVTGSQPS